MNCAYPAELPGPPTGSPQSTTMRARPAPSTPFILKTPKWWFRLRQAFTPTSQQFTALAACGGAGVNWTISSGAPGSLSANGLYTAPANIATQQTVAVTATSQASDAFTATATVTLLPAPSNATIILAAVAQPPYVTGSVQTFTATLKNGSGTPISGETVAFAVTGANSVTGSAITDANGVATYSYTGVNSGSDTMGPRQVSAANK